MLPLLILALVSVVAQGAEIRTQDGNVLILVDDTISNSVVIATPTQVLSNGAVTEDNGVVTMVRFGRLETC